FPMDARLRKESLTDTLAESRQEISMEVARLRKDVAFGEKLKRAIRERPGAWYGGAAFLGFVLSVFSWRAKNPARIQTGRSVPGMLPAGPGYPTRLLSVAAGSLAEDRFAALLRRPACRIPGTAGWKRIERRGEGNRVH